MTLAMLMVLAGIVLIYAGIKGQSVVAIVTLRGAEPSELPESARAETK